ncbi:hypothetical protein ERJ75_000689200 [Trypanosoma vivax]|nr:hypothetical protein ERJ75_000689200 [Trypanosoma vivax]
MRSPATPAHALRSLLVPALLLARGACSSSGCTSRLLRRPAFCFQDTPFCYAFGDAFRQLPQRLFARRGRRPVVPLSIPWLAVLGRVCPQAARANTAAGRRCQRAPSAASLVLMARPPRRRARHTLQALCCRLALRTPLRPLPFSLPCICGARRHAMRGRPTMAALLARKLGHAHASRRGPTLSQRRAGDDTASFAWRERKAARRCLGTVARAFAQGSARDRGGFRWPEGGARRMLAAALSQHRDAWQTHTHRNCVTEDTGSGRCAEQRTLRRPVRAATRVAGSLCREAASHCARQRSCGQAQDATHARTALTVTRPCLLALPPVVRRTLWGKGRRHGNGVVCVRQLGAGTASSDMAPR